MTEDTPDYAAIVPPTNTDPGDLSTHERRAAILEDIIDAGSPRALKQRRLAEKYQVHESTISRDMDALRESISEHLGSRARFATQVIFQHVINDLLSRDDWKAVAQAWEVAMDWNDWLFAIGEQARKPEDTSVNVNMHTSSGDIAYRIVRPDEAESLPRTADGAIDHAALGFTEGPEAVDSDAEVDDDS